MSAPDLVLLGNLLVDDLVFADGRTRMAQAGGAVLHAAHAAALWGTRAGIVSPCGDDYPRAALEALATRGVDLAGVRDLHAPGGRAWLLYEEEVRQIVHRVGRPTHEQLSPRAADVPADRRGARAYHIAPMPFAIQRELALALGGGDAYVSLDPHEPLNSETLPAWREVLAHVDAFFPSDDEWRLTSGSGDPADALRALAGGRLRHVFHKRGAHGGLALDLHTNESIAWQARAEQVVDPTGAGDAFAMGCVTARLAGLGLRGMIDRALVGASFAIAAWGSEGLAHATTTQAEARLAAWAASGVSS